jgi:hypothetical protein
MKRLSALLGLLASGFVGTGCVDVHSTDEGTHTRVRAPFTDVHVDSSDYDEYDDDVDVDVDVD